MIYFILFNYFRRVLAGLFIYRTDIVCIITVTEDHETPLTLMYTEGLFIYRTSASISKVGMYKVRKIGDAKK